MSIEQEIFNEELRGQLKYYDLLVTLSAFDEFYNDVTPVLVYNSETKTCIAALQFIPIMNLPEDIQNTCLDTLKQHQLVEYMDDNSLVNVIVI